MNDDLEFCSFDETTPTIEMLGKGLPLLVKLLHAYAETNEFGAYYLNHNQKVCRAGEYPKSNSSTLWIDFDRSYFCTEFGATRPMLFPINVPFHGQRLHMKEKSVYEGGHTCMVSVYEHFSGTFTKYDAISEIEKALEDGENKYRIDVMCDLLSNILYGVTL